jgi:hypothetical protein
MRQDKPAGFREEGLAGALLDFLKVLEDMDKKGETRRKITGEFDGPFGSRVEYDYVVTIGLGDDGRGMGRKKMDRSQENGK